VNISDEAVEAAARATFVHANLGAAWEDAQPDWRDAYRASVLAGLEAAAPYIAAEAYEDAADIIIAPGASSAAAAWLRERAAFIRSTNPYRSQA
jgi:hypothetical protein